MQSFNTKVYGIYRVNKNVNILEMCHGKHIRVPINAQIEREFRRKLFARNCSFVELGGWEDSHKWIDIEAGSSRGEGGVDSVSVGSAGGLWTGPSRQSLANDHTTSSPAFGCSLPHPHLHPSLSQVQDQISDISLQNLEKYDGAIRPITSLLAPRIKPFSHSLPVTFSCTWEFPQPLTLGIITAAK